MSSTTWRLRTTDTRAIGRQARLRCLDDDDLPADELTTTEQAARSGQEQTLAQSPPAYFAHLLETEQFADAQRFLAHALPPREALWWFCLCVWQVYRPEPPTRVAAVLDAVMAFLRKPSEGHRRACELLGRELGLRHPAGCLAMSVFYSGENIASPGNPAIRPRPEVVHKAVAGGIGLLSVWRCNAATRRLRRWEFLHLGQQVAAGALAWEHPRTLAAAVVEGSLPAATDQSATVSPGVTMPSVAGEAPLVATPSIGAAPEWTAPPVLAVAPPFVSPLQKDVTHG